MTTINYGKTDVDGRGDGTSACPLRRQAAPLLALASDARPVAGNPAAL